MPLTPSNPRMTSINPALSLRHTPSNSPHARHASARSPTKSGRSDNSILSLKQVIGSTITSANAFDVIPSARAIAFTAGAAAVIATFDDELHVTQRFYRARPTAVPLNTSPAIYGPSTPTQSSVDARSRTAASLQQAGIGASPFASPGGEWTDSPNGKSWSARERVKAATCVSFSPDGKFLAVGETGYRPRVLIFSTARDSPGDAPLTCLSDHTFGVRCVAFSPDSRYLASLGSSNDGFLYVWSVNRKTGAATLLATNKCSSNITRMAWVGSNLVTTGTRHVKVWRLDTGKEAGSSPCSEAETPRGARSPSNRTLFGRNCLLGPLLETTLTTIVPIGPTKAIICSEKGDICLLDHTEGNQRFERIMRVEFSITASAVDEHGNLILASFDGSTWEIALEGILETTIEWTGQRSLAMSCKPPYHIIALSPFLGHIVTAESHGGIRLHSVDPSVELENSRMDTAVLPSHGGAVQGVRPLRSLRDPAVLFMTWSARGSILFWGESGTCRGQVQVELEQLDYDGAVNELKVVRAVPQIDSVVTGDKYGVLQVLNQDDGAQNFTCKAHSGEITDIAVHEGNATFIASSGRDRTIQLFKHTDNAWELLQTLDEHVGAVTGVLFSTDGSRLLSCSADRTVVVRELASQEVNGKILTAHLIVRTITLRATPICMNLDPDRDDYLILSTIDRTVHKYNLRTGHASSSFKASDSDGGDAVVLSSMVFLPRST
ncbi:hypothetical protein LTS18_006276, partial [Coniosporium uncinatum]